MWWCEADTLLAQDSVLIGPRHLEKDREPWYSSSSHPLLDVGVNDGIRAKQLYRTIYSTITTALGVVWFPEALSIELKCLSSLCEK